MLPLQSIPPARFLWATCQVGAESALKDEMARGSLAMVPAFTRPGFVTFKLAEPLTQWNQFAGLRPCFARTVVISLDRLKDDHLNAAAEQMWQLPAVRDLIQQVNRLDLHVWQRDLAEPGDRGFRPGITALSEETATAIWKAAPASAVSDEPPELRQPSRRNAPVLDVVLVEPSQWWVGCHLAQSWLARWPGGFFSLELPGDAISRAYLKTSEALAWARPPIARGDLVAELGCAPGGSSQALLSRGLHVMGIDPADVDESVLVHPHFTHIRKRARDMRRREFRDVRWLFADLNVAPNYTLDVVEDVVAHPATHIRGLVLTLKLLDWSLAADLPEWCDRVRKWGYRDVRVRQLASGGREVCMVALRSRAQRRIRRD